MPIRPEKKHLYPSRDEWAALRTLIMERATWACECSGECGRPHAGGACIVPNRILAARYTKDGLETWHEHEHTGNCLVEPCDDSEPRDGAKVVRVVLTLAHLDHDPTNNDHANLRALCQRCHLRYDAAEHARTRAATKAASRRAQLVLVRTP